MFKCFLMFSGVTEREHSSEMDKVMLGCCCGNCQQFS